MVQDSRTEYTMSTRWTKGSKGGGNEEFEETTKRKETRDLPPSSPESWYRKDKGLYGESGVHKFVEGYTVVEGLDVDVGTGGVLCVSVRRDGYTGGRGPYSHHRVFLCGFCLEN